MPPALGPDLAASFDKALPLIGQTLPGRGIALDAASGRAWTSTLRDDDEVIGIGHAATAPLAISFALQQVPISRAKGYS